jgi:hypothetical protein
MIDGIRIGIAVAGLLAVGFMLFLDFPRIPPSPSAAGFGAAACLIAAGHAATAVRYLKTIEPAHLPEAAGLARGGRVLAWMLVIAAGSIGLAWLGQQTALRMVHWTFLIVNVSVCYSLLVMKAPAGEPIAIFPLDLGVLSMLGSRANVVGSLLDAAERQLGIDLRNAWGRRWEGSRCHQGFIFTGRGLWTTYCEFPSGMSSC